MVDVVFLGDKGEYKLVSKGDDSSEFEEQIKQHISQIVADPIKKDGETPRFVTKAFEEVLPNYKFNIDVTIIFMLSQVYDSEST